MSRKTRSRTENTRLRREKFPLKVSESFTFFFVSRGLASFVRPVKKLLLPLLSFYVANVFAADTAQFPENLKLLSGTVLKHCSVVRFTSDSVVVRHSGGVDPIRFDRIAADQRAAVEAARVAASVVSIKAPVAGATSAMRALSGQVFVTTRGAGAYKFSGVSVFAFPAEKFEEALRAESMNLPGGFRLMAGEDRSVVTMKQAWLEALSKVGGVSAEATTDAEGKFTLKLPAGVKFYLFCHAHRLAGAHEENNLWVVPAPDDGDALLNNTNQWVQP